MSEASMAVTGAAGQCVFIHQYVSPSILFLSTLPCALRSTAHCHNCARRARHLCRPRDHARSLLPRCPRRRKGVKADISSLAETAAAFAGTPGVFGLTQFYVHGLEGQQPPWEEPR
ncbi:hypothetical protein FKP32DRAFT_319667 [Trametes sanguinea]|nr:hypothetical protein FKP32DRAFT_319667 [Trametes sanguinea]